MSGEKITVAELESALVRRLNAVAERLADESPIPSSGAQELLRTLVDTVIRADESSGYWLLFVAISGSMPTQVQLSVFRRELALSAPAGRVDAALGATVSVARQGRTGLRELELVDDRMIIDVTFCSQHDHNTGIQRVVRATLPRWDGSADSFTLVRWSPDGGGYRRLTEKETARVMDWRTPPPGSVAAPILRRSDSGAETILVPWKTVLFLPEVPSFEQCSPLASVGEASGNDVVLIGYDAIPIVTAESVPSAESSRFAQYLNVVKHASRVAAISESAAEEFRGFAQALPVQGLASPDVTGIPLAVDVPDAARATQRRTSSGDLPLVVCVGSHEPRKNQEAVLFAGEMLFRESMAFRLVFVGGGSRSVTSSFDREIQRLQKVGMAVESHRKLGDRELWQLFADARFSVFVSKHEGFGLPVAESIALGTPVLTSDFGSLAEIATLGGCVTVDPRDDAAIVSAMRTMLVDDALIEQLTSEAAAVPERRWAQYAEELWAYAAGDRISTEAVGR